MLDRVQQANMTTACFRARGAIHVLVAEAVSEAVLADATWRCSIVSTERCPQPKSQLQGTGCITLDAASDHMLRLPSPAQFSSQVEAMFRSARSG